MKESLLMLGLLVLQITLASAAVLQFDFEAEVTTDAGSDLVDVGDVIQGFFAYDVDPSSAARFPNDRGPHTWDRPAPPIGITIDANGTLLTQHPDNFAQLHVLDEMEIFGGDILDFTSLIGERMAEDPFEYSGPKIVLVLVDRQGTAFGSSDLPRTLTLSDFERADVTVYADASTPLFVATLTTLVQDRELIEIVQPLEGAPNLQTGLFEEVVRVNNFTSETQSALLVWVHLDPDSALQGARVWNSMGTSNGVPYLLHNHSLSPGTSVDLTVEYYVPDRRTLPTTMYVVEEVPAESSPVIEGTPVTLDRAMRLANGDFLVEFNTLAGRLYYIEYSEDMVGWNTVLPPITGTGSRVQWIDNGPPKTHRRPDTGTSRFYRALRTP